MRDHYSLAEKLIDFLEIKFLESLADPKNKPIGLATGRTMKPIYASLVSRLIAWPESDLNRLRDFWCSFNLDEYVGLEKVSSNSFTAYMSRYLFSPLGLLSSEKTFIPNGFTKDSFEEACNYMNKLKIYGGIGFQLLGLGLNGHIGFNEPPCGPDNTCRVVNLSLSTRQQNAFSFGGSLDMVPTKAITLGIKEILEADEIHLVVVGVEKKNILKSLIESECSNYLPASWLRLHPKVYLWADQNAIGN